MFSSRRVEPVAPKPNSDATVPKPPPPASNGSRVVSPTSGCVLSSGVSIKGSVRFQKELVIDGEIEGQIDSGGSLTIGVNAKVVGDIQTKSIIVNGTVEGNITAEERCELRARCSVIGDIESPRLVVDEAATFIGSAKISTKKP